MTFVTKPMPIIIALFSHWKVIRLIEHMTILAIVTVWIITLLYKYCRMLVVGNIINFDELYG